MFFDSGLVCIFVCVLLVSSPKSHSSTIPLLLKLFCWFYSTNPRVASANLPIPLSISSPIVVFYLLILEKQNSSLIDDFTQHWDVFLLVVEENVVLRLIKIAIKETLNLNFHFVQSICKTTHLLFIFVNRLQCF